MSNDQLQILFVTCAPRQADSLARTLLEERLVGCVNAIPGVVSHYWWQGAIERDEEVVLLMETTRERVAEAVTRLRALHDYDVPKIVVIDSADVNADYAAWLQGVLAQR